MSKLKIHAGPFVFDARLEMDAAPKTCAAFARRLPFEGQIVHVRWSGEGVWIPLGDYDFGVTYENHTSFPAPGEILLYPGGYSETEILFPYGGTMFASIVGHANVVGFQFHPEKSQINGLKLLENFCYWDGRC